MKVKIIACTIKSALILLLISVCSGLSSPLATLAAEKINLLETERINGLITLTEFDLMSKFYNTIPKACGVVMFVLLVLFVLNIALTMYDIRKGE